MLGAGVLGGQIAWHSASKGKTVVVCDPFPEALRKAQAALETYDRIHAADPGASDADIDATWARRAFSGDLAAVSRFAIEIGMAPIAVQQEQNAHVHNSWLVLPLMASPTLVVNGVSTAEHVERFMEK